MKLHVLSDLHLSVASFDAPKTNADVVILAGDIARPKEAMAWASSFTQPVLYVPGNHEFYGGSMASTVHELKQLGAPSNIRVLDNDAVVIGGVRFLGTTLWTDFLLFGEGEKRDLAIHEALGFMRDFVRIRMDDVSTAMFTPTDSAVLFSRHASWLESKLAEPFPGQTVVITHHAPSPGSIHPRFADSPLNACFVSNGERLIDGRRVALWIHGHTHDSFDYVVNGTRVVCNPRGYARNGVSENPRFDPNLVLEVDS
ncbi:Metallophosphoesterase [Candidatus Accumulibacter aalborgensis]|uniref:Metallophosphoesterase n=1 Tax=Candidatus Accumulibacter aalborgensis TaxID=1860102 RepID=A0A1A8XQF8_9PROT|nr:metallophosphoesterase [Candidatus Accumulibacter aalborgensis]SBT07394.1 Metallophosphoesterase [Candidatus Accumulibacter aalborgensis]